MSVRLSKVKMKLVFRDSVTVSLKSELKMKGRVEKEVRQNETISS